MSSGGKQLIFNTRERVVSNDENRSQAFIDYELSEVLRRLMSNRQTVSPFTHGGGVAEFGGYVDTVAMDSAAIGTPLKGDVLEGLVVLPQTGTLNLLVSPGSVILDDPDGQTGSSQSSPPSPDDSRGKLVLDPGIQTAGVLTIAAGSVGGTRIDVIECRRQQVILETDSRDVFDPGTETFAPQVVNKVVASRLTYRVRQGTAGAGMPANVQGWLPLCVASVPTSATNVDTVSFWDVRPLVKDRVNAPSETQRVLSTLDPASTLTRMDSGTDDLAFGYLTSQLGMYRAGGVINIDFYNPNLLAPGFTPTLGAVWNLYAVFPRGLPRWVPYTPGPGLRYPEGPNGILTITDTPSFPTPAQNSILPPAIYGIDVAGPAVLLTAGFCSATVPVGTTVAAGLHRPYPSGQSIAATSSTSQVDSYTLVPGVDFPAGARSLLISFVAALTSTPAEFTYGSFFPVTVLDAPAGNTLYQITGSGQMRGPTASTVLVQVYEVQVPAFQQSIGLPDDNLHIDFAWALGSATKTAGSLNVLGFRF